jgi:hypothetical protein
MANQEEYEKNNWHFDGTGGHVVVGWKNVKLKDGNSGCVTLSSDAVVARRQSCASYNDIAEMMWHERTL